MGRIGADDSICGARACSPNSQIGYERNADLVAPDECGPCSCGAPSCELPAGLTAHSTQCPGDGLGNVDTPFNAPPDWDGACVAPPAVPANLLGSVTIAPLTVSSCVAETGPIPKQGQAYWKKYARAYQGDAFGPCPDPATACAPTAEPPPDGFVQCIKYLMPGDADCPDKYPVKHVEPAWVLLGERRVPYGEATPTAPSTFCCQE